MEQKQKILKVEEQESRVREVFEEIMAKSFTSLVRDINQWINETNPK